MWDPSTIAIDKTELTFFQNLEAPERLHCSLVVYSGGDTGRQITLEEGTHSIGRSAAAQLAIDGPGMSRLHAEVTVQGGSVLLRDLGSANGTFVQDQRLNGPRLLNDGDLLRLGSVLLKFYEHRSVDAALHDRVYRLAMIDAGTGLYNRRYLNDALRRELRLARQRRQPLAVISLDLDHFKRVNDGYGHAAGDLVLRECAVLLGPLVGSAGILGRLGGEEFLVLLPNTPLAAALALAERLRAAVASRAFMLPVGEGEGRRSILHRQTVSLGVAEWGPAMLETCDLLDAADRRLYQAKHEGRDRVSG
jgi:diguanylate cyclase (GGDEF)-like protein